MLNAAAMTYLAAAVTSILQLLYYISVANRRG
jgi:Zn-dependent membrane protease YugP